MNELQRARLALWNAAQADADQRALIADINDLRAELAAVNADHLAYQHDTEWLIAELNKVVDEERAANADLRAELAATRIRLAASLERERQMCQRRRWSLWGAGVALCDRIIGRTR